MRQRLTWPAAVVGTLLLATTLLVVIDQRYFFYGDTQAAYYGWWHHLGSELRAGHWPRLDPSAWRAGNLAAEGQWGLFSPLVMGIGLLATVAPSTLVLAGAVKVGLMVTGALGVFALARSYGAAPPLAYLAAVAAPMGGMTQYLDLPSWAAGLMIWALLPWTWLGLRRLAHGAGPAPALAVGYLLVTVGYVYGTIMLGVVLTAVLLDCVLARDRRAALRVAGAGALLGLVAVAVYLPGVLTAPVTVRAEEYGAPYPKLTTDPAALLTSVLPTGVRPGTTLTLLPYAYLAWFLPLLLFVDLRRVREGVRSIAGLLLVTTAMVAVVLGPAELGALRFPLRLQPFLVQAGVLLVAVLSQGLVRRPSGARLGLALAWVGIAGLVAVLRAPETRSWQIAAAVLVGVLVTAIWAAVRRGRPLALLAGVATLAAFALQHAAFPEPPSPDRNMPAALSDYRRPLTTAVGDVLVVGNEGRLLEAEPDAARELLAGSAWYLSGHRVVNTYTAISHQEFKARYCMSYVGSTCAELLQTLFSPEPVTGQARVDLLGVSTLVLVKRYVAGDPPDGWRVAEDGEWTQTWVRETPLPGAGHPVWTSPGTRITAMSVDDEVTGLRVDEVPAGGGTVVLATLAWPGWRSSAGELAEPVDGYLLTLDLPESATGSTLTVSFSPPGWWAELACWWLAVLAGLGWAVVDVRRRRLTSRARTSPEVSQRPG